MSTPADLIMRLRAERGADAGPPANTYTDNRSLEDPDELDGSQVELVPGERHQFPMPVPVPEHFDFQGDFVDLAGCLARIGKFECQISEKEQKAIQTIVIKAIRRELRQMERR